MLLYVETWLPLLTVGLIVAILCGVASLIIERVES